MRNYDRPDRGLNLKEQEYRGIKIRLISRGDYPYRQAKRFLIIGTNDSQNVWIPNKHLAEDGTLLPGQDIDYVFRKASHKLNLAGITQAIPGIKRRYVEQEEKSHDGRY